MTTLSQQASAVEVAVRILSGAARKPSRKEQDHIVAGLKAASVTLRNAEYDQARL